MKYIYLLQSPVSNRIYIGQATNPNKRFLNHRNDSKTKNKLFKDRWFRKCSVDGFEPTMTILCDCDDNDVDNMERFYIKFFKGCGFELTNLDNGGQAGKQLTYRTRKKISKSSAKYWLGKKLSDETKNKMSVVKKGKPANNRTPLQIIRKIQEDYSSGKYTVIELASKYNLNRKSIGLYINNKYNHGTTIVQ